MRGKRPPLSPAFGRAMREITLRGELRAPVWLTLALIRAPRHVAYRPERAGAWLTRRANRSTFVLMGVETLGIRERGEKYIQGKDTSEFTLWKTGGKC